jgi:hypothetical protein
MGGSARADVQARYLAVERPLVSGRNSATLSQRGAREKADVVAALEALDDQFVADDEMHASDTGATLAGFVVKAAIGFSRLALAALKSLQGAKVVIGTLVLTATVSEGKTQLTTSLASVSPPWHPPREDCALLGFQLRSGIAVRGRLTRSCTWETSGSLRAWS